MGHFYPAKWLWCSAVVYVYCEQVIVWQWYRIKKKQPQNEARSVGERGCSLLKVLSRLTERQQRNVNQWQEGRNLISLSKSSGCNQKTCSTFTKSHKKGKDDKPKRNQRKKKYLLWPWSPRVAPHPKLLRTNVSSKVFHRVCKMLVEPLLMQRPPPHLPILQQAMDHLVAVTGMQASAVASGSCLLSRVGCLPVIAPFKLTGTWRSLYQRLLFGGISAYFSAAKSRRFPLAETKIGFRVKRLQVLTYVSFRCADGKHHVIVLGSALSDPQMCKDVKLRIRVLISTGE